MSTWITFLVFIVGGIYLGSTVRIAPDHQRFVIYALGQFKELKGPGMFFKFSGSAIEWFRVNLGDRGELVADDKIKIKDKVIPAAVQGAILLGTEYMITDFTDTSVVLAKPQSEIEKAG